MTGVEPRPRLAPGDAAAVPGFVEKVRGGLGGDVLEMRLFGSKATGEDVPGSDIDILVVVQDARVDVEDRVLAIAFDVNLAHDVYISPRVVGRLHEGVLTDTSFTGPRSGVLQASSGRLLTEVHDVPRRGGD